MVTSRLVAPVDTSRLEAPRPGSRAARLAVPRSVDVVKQLAAEFQVCTRPVTLRRTDLDTGRTEIVDIRCGATLEAKCPACAAKAVRLRQRQIREGWHRDDEPLPAPSAPSDDQVGLVVLRAHLEFQRAHDAASADWPGVAECDSEIGILEEQIAATGLRGRPAPVHTDTGQPGQSGQGRRRRSTRRRADVPDLPRRKVEDRTTGRVYVAPEGKTWRPSLFLTVTLPSYGRVNTDGTPADPDRYDYRAAAWDAIHFPRLLDRFWQNLRRAVGWNVQYAGAVEPQRRLAPHAHFAIRGTIARDLIRRVAAATYHQVWWPPARLPCYTPQRLPVWDEGQAAWLDPDSRARLSTWDETLDVLDGDPDAEPAHVVRLGTQLMAHGLLAGSEQANRRVGYITKYLTKHAADCHRTETVRQQAHLERLWQELRHTPCTPRCPNWLLYGVQPHGVHGRMRPGFCRGKVHQRATLGIGGRRVLVSRNWSGKTLADHKYDARAWVRQLLGVTAGHQASEEQAVSASRYGWEKARPTDPDVAPLGHRLLRRVSEVIQNRNARAQAKMATGPPEAASDVSATATMQPDPPPEPAAPTRDSKPNRVGRRADRPAGGRRVGDGGTAVTSARTRPAVPRARAAGRTKEPAPRSAMDEAARVRSLASVDAPEVDARIAGLVADAPPLSERDQQRLGFLFGDGIAAVARAQAAEADS